MQNRIVYLDILRVIAIFFVIVIHVSSQGWLWNSLTIDQINGWKFFSVYQSLVIAGVPLFVMISGALMIKPIKEDNINDMYYVTEYKKIFLKVIRLICALFFWLCVYELFSIFFSKTIFTFSIYKIIKSFLFGVSEYGHFWYVYMIIGLYLLTPLLKIFLNYSSRKGTEIIIVLFVFFGILVPFLNLILNLFFENNLKFQFVIPELSTFLGYYILGYYLFNYQIKKKIKIYVYFFSILSLLIIVFGTWQISFKSNHPITFLFDSFLPFCFAICFSIFILVKDLFSKIKFSLRVQHLIVSISNCSFGIYLIHMLYILLFERFGVTSLSFNFIYSVPLVSFLVFIMSYFTIYLLNKIPFLSKYIV